MQEQAALDGAPTGAPAPTDADVQRLFFQEAALLDAWRLQEWLSLLTGDATYLVPPTDSPDADHRTTLFLVADTYPMLKSRVEQLLGKVNWAESPHSRTRRLVSNCMVLEASDGHATVTANFAVWNFHHALTNTYVGRYVYRLRLEHGRWLIHERRAILDMEALRPHGKLSFIL